MPLFSNFNNSHVFFHLFKKVHNIQHSCLIKDSAHIAIIITTMSIVYCYY